MLLLWALCRNKIICLCLVACGFLFPPPFYLFIQLHFFLSTCFLCSWNAVLTLKRWEPAETDRTAGATKLTAHVRAAFCGASALITATLSQSSEEAAVFYSSGSDPAALWVGLIPQNFFLAVQWVWIYQNGSVLAMKMFIGCRHISAER